MKPKKIFVGIACYDRNEDVKFSEEIIKYSFKNHDYKICVYYNGKKEWDNYLEDILIKDEPERTQKGCLNGINKTWKEVSNSGCEILLYMQANVLILKEEWVDRALEKMEREGKPFSAFQQGYPETHTGHFDNFSVEAFLVDIEWAKKTKFLPIVADGVCIECRFANQYENTVGKNNLEKFFARMNWMEPGPHYHNPKDPTSNRFQNLEASISYHHNPKYTALNLKNFGYPQNEKQVYIKRVVLEEDLSWVNIGSKTNK